MGNFVCGSLFPWASAGTVPKPEPARLTSLWEAGTGEILLNYGGAPEIEENLEDPRGP